MDVNDLSWKKDEQMTGSGSANTNLSIKVHGVDIYQPCIDSLLPQRLLNDNIVAILIEYVMST